MATLYFASDSGAPVMNNVTGNLITVLDAILVDGYGDKPAAGWTKEFHSGNVAVYRNNPVTGSGMYLRIECTSAEVARIRGYATMTDINTGTIPAPVDAEVSGGFYFHMHYQTGGSTWPKGWGCIADDRTFYFFVSTIGYSHTVASNTRSHYPLMAGDFESYIEDHTVNWFVGASPNAGTPGNPGASGGTYYPLTSTINWTSTTTGMAVGWTDAARAASLNSLQQQWEQNFWTDIEWPHPHTNRIWFQPALIHIRQPHKAIIGRLRGLWQFYNSLPAATTWDGAPYQAITDVVGFENSTVHSFELQGLGSSAKSFFPFSLNEGW